MAIETKLDAPFRGFGCAETHSQNATPSCKSGGAICSPHYKSGDRSEWLTKVKNQPYNNSEFSGRREFVFGRPNGLKNYANVTNESIPVLGFVVSQGAAFIKRGLLSIDYPVDKLLVVQMGNNVAVSKALTDIKKYHEHLATLTIVKLPNLGCAAGWNRIIIENLYAPYWFILNFDIAFPKGALARITAEASDIFRQHERIGMIHLWYQGGGYKPEWSAFLLRREMVHDIGFFDENNWPARQEDMDYSIRMAGSPYREPWYRQLLPARNDEGQCPDLYVFHGVGDQQWRGGTSRVNSESSKRSKKCMEASTRYEDWQRRRGLVSFTPNKWGEGGGPMTSNECYDPRMTAKVNDVRVTAYHNHPTGADYFPPAVPWVPFSTPFGHYGLPVWFWVLDPHLRRCILGVQSTSTPRRALIAKRQTRAILPWGCRSSSIPYAFNRVQGLPEKCIDALSLCMSSLTSSYKESKLQRLNLIPEYSSTDCEEVKELPEPPPLESLLGPTKTGCPTNGKHSTSPSKKEKKEGGQKKEGGPKHKRTIKQTDNMTSSLWIYTILLGVPVFIWLLASCGSDGWWW